MAVAALVADALAAAVGALAVGLAEDLLNRVAPPHIDRDGPELLGEVEPVVLSGLAWRFCVFL